MWTQLGPYLYRETVQCTEPRLLYRIEIQGAQGTVTAENIIWTTARLDLIDCYYTEIIKVLNGEYHCCLSGNVDWL